MAVEIRLVDPMPQPFPDAFGAGFGLLFLSLYSHRYQMEQRIPSCPKSSRFSPSTVWPVTARTVN